jgi:hypothetical protein
MANAVLGMARTSRPHTNSLGRISCEEDFAFPFSAFVGGIEVHGYQQQAQPLPI